MTPLERRNERLKLTANWANTIATAIMTVGAFVPTGQMIFKFLPEKVDLNQVNRIGFICIVLAVFIHLSGQWILGGLK
jgi:hypothetical protein